MTDPKMTDPKMTDPKMTDPKMTDPKMTGPKISPEDFDALVRASGLKLSDKQKAEIRTGYAHIEAMVARVRGAGSRPRESEPAAIFRAEK